MSTDTTSAPVAHPAAAPEISTFDPDNEAHQRLWQLACEFSGLDAGTHAAASEEPANDPLPYGITGAATDLATLLRSIQHLTQALDSAVDDLDFSSESTNETAERILTFSRLIDWRAKEGADTAEKIEMAAHAASREARAATPRPVAADREWKRILLAFNWAKARLEEHCAASPGAASDAPETVAYEEGTDKLADAFDEAATRLLLTEAPDPQALQVKLDLLASSELTDSVWTKRADFARQVAKDGQRLLDCGAADRETTHA